MRSWIRKTLLLAAMASSTTAARAQYSMYDPNGTYAPTSGQGPYAVPMPGGGPAQGYPVAGMPMHGAAPNYEGAPMPGGMPDGGPVADPSAAMAAIPGYSLTPPGQRFSVRGWFDGGGIYNEGNPGSNYNGPYNSVYRSNEGAFNQAYLIAEYCLPQDGSFGVGGRIDALWGQDFLLAQSIGMEKNPNGTRKWNSSPYYGVALPQGYAQVGTLASNLKVGHFYGLLGYESVMATNNFFYSKSYSYQFSQPYTLWGAVGSHYLNDQLQILAGAHFGWDTLDRVQTNVSGIAGLKYLGMEKNWWSSFTVTSGEEPTNLALNAAVPLGFSNRTTYSFIVDVCLTDRLEWVGHHFLGLQDNGDPGGGVAYWYGADTYVYYRLSDCLKFGGRGEWFRDEDGTRVGLTLPNNPNRAPLPGNYYSATVGFNYTPWANLMIRPEARWDFSGETVRLPYNDGTRSNQWMLGMDAILRF